MSFLTVENVGIRFGGLVALADVSLDVTQGEVYSIIGPNGAGKTTLFNIISGLYRPTSGHVRLDGEQITGLAPVKLAKAGLRRTFQNLQLCPSMTVIENVMVGAHLSLPHGFVQGALRFASLRRAEQSTCHRCEELLDFVGITRVDHSRLAGQLPYGAMRRLEIARALAGNPRLLLLDEPAAGLNNSETVEMAELIRKIARSATTIVLVEHDMGLVMKVSDRIMVLNYGRTLAIGTPTEIQNEPHVIAAYLGEEDPQ